MLRPNSHRTVWRPPLAPCLVGWRGGVCVFYIALTETALAGFGNINIAGCPGGLRDLQDRVVVCRSSD